MNKYAIGLTVLSVCLAACSSDPDRQRPNSSPFDEGRLIDQYKERQERNLDARGLYLLARQSLDSGDFLSALERYDRLVSEFPFTPYAIQSALERIYALYRNFQPDRALSAADRFLREYPRHQAADYVHYAKGLINYERDDSPIDLFSEDASKSDVTSIRRAFDDFSLLIQKYPTSRYAGDARERMIHIRNRLANHEMHVVDFYMRRGAYIAAAKRAEQVIAEYPGSPASYRALETLVKAYEQAKLKIQAEDARKLLAAQTPPGQHLNPGEAEAAAPDSELEAPQAES